MYIDCTAYINDVYTLILDPLKGALLSLAGQPLRWRRKGLVNCFISTRAGAE